MTDPNPSGATPPAGDPSTNGPSAEVDWQKEAEKWQALSRKNEARAKENSDAAAELQTIKESQMSEQQKAQKAAEKSAAEAAAAKSELARYRVAAAKGVPVELLNGADEDTLNAQADALLAFAGQQTSTPPVPDLGQGNRGATPPQDANAWIRANVGR